MKHLVRVALAAIAFAFCTTITASTLDAQPQLKSITIGLNSKTMTDWPLYIAQAQGFFTANGLKPDIVYAMSGPSGAQELVAGSIDIDENSIAQALEAYEGGGPVAVVMVRSNSVPYTIVGAKGLTSVAQLRGKSVVVGAPNDINRVYTDTVLERNGLHPSDITYLYAADTVSRFAELVSGQVGAVILNPPFSFKAESLGYPALAETYTYYPNFPVDIFMVNTARISAHADETVAFLKSFIQGVRYFYNPANRARCIQILADAINATPSDAAKTYNYLQRIKYFSTTGIAGNPDLERVVSAIGKAGDLSSAAPPTGKWTDFHFVRQADQQLGKSR